MVDVPYNLIEGTEYTVDYFSDLSGQVVSIVPRARLKIKNGESVVGITKNEKDMISLVEKTAKALNLIGQNNIQCFKLRYCS